MRETLRERIAEKLCEIRRQAHDIGWANGCRAALGNRRAEQLRESRAAAEVLQLEDDAILALLADSEPVSWAYWAASGASLTDSPAEAQMWRDAGYNVVSLYTSPTPTKPEGGEG